MPKQRLKKTVLKGYRETNSSDVTVEGSSILVRPYAADNNNVWFSTQGLTRYILHIQMGC